MKKTTINEGFGILVLERGNVLVGEYSFADQDQIITVRGGAIIRRWGTTKGLGELAGGGPTKETVLDKLNRDCFVAKSGLIYVLDCCKDQWPL